jgi:hypothetical protein
MNQKSRVIPTDPAVVGFTAREFLRARAAFQGRRVELVDIGGFA